MCSGLACYVRDDVGRVTALKDTWGYSRATVIRRLLLDAVKQEGPSEPETRAVVDGSARPAHASTEPAIPGITDDTLPVGMETQRRTWGKTDIEEDASHRPIWEVIEEVMSQVPAEDLADLPTDPAEQQDHYIYGAPKR
jgi:hypothetical protein